MLVCHCFAVCDRTIREAIRNGACSAEAVATVCGAGAGCGGCQETVEDLLAAEVGPADAPIVQLRRRDASPDSGMSQSSGG